MVRRTIGRLWMVCLLVAILGCPGVKREELSELKRKLTDFHNATYEWEKSWLKAYCRIEGANETVVGPDAVCSNGNPDPTKPPKPPDLGD